MTNLNQHLNTHWLKYTICNCCFFQSATQLFNFQNLNDDNNHVEFFNFMIFLNSIKELDIFIIIVLVYDKFFMVLILVLFEN